MALLKSKLARNPAADRLFILSSQLPSLLVLLGYLVVGFGLSQVLSLLLMLASVGSEEAITNMLQHPEQYPDAWDLLMTSQLINATILFIVTPYLYLRLSEKIRFKWLFYKQVRKDLLAFIILLLVFVYLPLSAWVTYQNEHIVLPEALSGLETLLRNTEQQLRNMTLFLIQFEGLAQFFVALLVIAAIPGFGEELLFRGVLQNKLYALFKNQHVAIWLAAFVFGAIHLQFYGMLTRTLLGALFGYLYVYSGNLFYPMLLHFLNNAITLIFTRLVIMGEQEEELTDLIETPAIPILYALLSLVGTLALVYWFRKRAIKPQWV